MECPLKGWLSGVAAAATAARPRSRRLPNTSREQNTSPHGGGPARVQGRQVGRPHRAQEQHLDGRVTLRQPDPDPLCWVTHAHYVFTRKYLDHEELKRDVLRARVFYWKRGFRETEVDTLVKPKGEDDA